MTDPVPLTLFHQVYRRAPTEADRNRLLGAKAALGLSDHDELWPLFLTLDHYTAVHTDARRAIIKSVRDLPDRVKETVAEVEGAVSSRSDRAIAQVVENGAARIAEIVVRRSQETAERISKREFTVAAIVGGCLAMTCLAAGALMGFWFSAVQLGTCTSQPFPVTDGRTACYVD